MNCNSFKDLFFLRDTWIMSILTMLQPLLEFEYEYKKDKEDI